METPPPLNRAAESPAHRELKRLALLWAQTNGFRIAAAEVSLPQYRVRMDAAACKLERQGRATHIGATAIFECKASAPDFRRDAHGHAATLERLEALHVRRLRVEEELRLYYPSIRNGDSLFPEYETLNFERSGYERYEVVMTQIRRLTAVLYEGTKFDRLAQQNVANLFYVVADPGVLRAHELPAGWGCLERVGDSLVQTAKPHWHEVSEDSRDFFLQRIALAGTRAVNREHGVVLPPEG